jgi:hypothetical protein
VSGSFPSGSILTRFAVLIRSTEPDLALNCAPVTGGSNCSASRAFTRTFWPIAGFPGDGIAPSGTGSARK